VAVASGITLLVAFAAAPATAAVLIREDFSDGALGPTPDASAWNNPSGHEFGATSSFANDRHLALTYDHDNNAGTDEVPIPGGYEINGYVPSATLPATLTIMATLPSSLDTSDLARLTFWATGRDGVQTAANSSVSIKDVTDNVVVLPPTTPTLNPFLTGDGRPKWQYNEFTFPQLDTYAGDTFEVAFNGGGTNGATGLVMTDLTFTAAAAVPEPASLSAIGLGGLVLLRRRRRRR
jgi:hypothetical protein